jgi:phage terminase small subunit
MAKCHSRDCIYGGLKSVMFLPYIVNKNWGGHLTLIETRKLLKSVNKQLLASFCMRLKKIMVFYW